MESVVGFSSFGRRGKKRGVKVPKPTKQKSTLIMLNYFLKAIISGKVIATKQTPKQWEDGGGERQYSGDWKNICTFLVMC